MSVREEDRRKNSCSSRGLGLAAAAIGVGVGAALYYFFSKRPEQPDSEGSTSEGWTCEQPQTFDASEYTTISEHTTTDTSICLTDERNKLEMWSRLGNSSRRTIDLTETDSEDDMACDNCHSNDTCDNISVASETSCEDSETTDSNESYDPEQSDVEEEEDAGSNDLNSSSSTYSNIDTSDPWRITENDVNYSTTNQFDVETISDSDLSREWDVTHSTTDSIPTTPRDETFQGYLRSLLRISPIPIRSNTSMLGDNLMRLATGSTPKKVELSQTQISKALSEDEQMAILRDQAFRERKWSLEECSICFEIMLRDQELMSLPCTHNFHVACIGPWLQEQQTCPVCRKSAD